MDLPFVEEFVVQNYGCIRDASFRFGPLHALIGPNDSGKSTVLRALRTMSTLWSGRTPRERDMLSRALDASSVSSNVDLKVSTSALDLKLQRRGLFSPTTIKEFEGGATLQYRHSSKDGGTIRSFTKPISNKIDTAWKPMNQGQPKNGAFDLVWMALHPTQLLRLDPDSLRTPCPLIPEGQPLRFQDEHGLGLPAIYDAIVTRDVHAFLELNTEIQKLFPDVKSIALLNPDAGHKAIGVKLMNGTLVPAELMSEGLLYYLAFAALRFMDPPAILLIEEPENGLHPARIAEVMRVLREISKTIQVILATHSPLVVNELQPDEVTVVTRTREEGTKAVLLKDTPNFEERSKVYALGELWLSYADGNQEEALLKGGPRP